MKHPLIRSLRMENGALHLSPHHRIPLGKYVRTFASIMERSITRSMVMAYRSCLTSTRPLAVGPRTPTNGR